MGFKCGLVGMPNVGKSSIFNLLTSQKIDAKNFPFCTIDPNIATVEVPDERLDKLSVLNSSKSKVNAVIEFVDRDIEAKKVDKKKTEKSTATEKKVETPKEATV